MAVEIERKFLVKSLPANFDNHGGKVIRQGYLIITDTGTELRVRQKQDRFYQTLKKGEGLSRTEIEIELTKNQFDRLWPHTEGRRVLKTRYIVPVGDFTAELDRFANQLSGLLLVEVEFDSVEAGSAFNPPDWFGTDVTEDERYKNKYLAEHGIPE